MATSTCDIDLYEDIKHCVGETNMPGVRDHIYMIRKEDITTWPEKGEASAEGATLASIVTITGNFTLASSAKWKKLSLTPDASSFNAESQGNWGSKTFNNTINVIMPGIQAEATGLCAMLNNDDVVFLIPMRDGKCRLFGNESFQCTINPKQESGTAVTDSAQTTLEISVTDVTPAPFYEGTIVTSDGNISGKTDTAVVTGA